MWPVVLLKQFGFPVDRFIWFKAFSPPNEQGQTRSRVCQLLPAAGGSVIVHNVLLKIILARTLLNFENNHVEKFKIFLAIRKIVSCLEKTVISPAASTSRTKTAGANCLATEPVT